MLTSHIKSQARGLAASSPPPSHGLLDSDRYQGLGESLAETSDGGRRTKALGRRRTITDRARLVSIHLSWSGSR
ncbi:hypothetical protein JMJ77_0008882 [Colletotrichum scovillei]|uniref:Uncharacterized protein n=1 Tax=Colletotrichum scovillei TaxID=1209932 RepID=A0A9P7QU55_9PEZI|nr:hypothetical protein JMJ78_0001740 [Colletotrichum scovillei]KAG7041178.1 hypothetical protein JMJ77_0008882 [Colletotrichum scovillei]KAG7061210.1 hypothetical protein JMJ76_0010279 [Colletotrichum scovillei]